MRQVQAIVDQHHDVKTATKVRFQEPGLDGKTSPIPEEQKAPVSEEEKDAEKDEKGSSESKEDGKLSSPEKAKSTSITP